MAIQLLKLVSGKSNALKTLALVASAGPRLRQFIGVIGKSFAKGKIKSFKNIGENVEVQVLVAKFNQKESSHYTKMLVPLGFPTIADIQKLSRATLRRQVDKLAEHPLSKSQLEGEAQEVLQEHIDYLTNESFFQKAHREAQKQDIIGRSPEAREWYHDYAAAYGTSFSYTQMLKEGGRRAGRPIRGKMMFFKYRPDIVETTYDLYPLIFVLNSKPGYFDGINFHYLTPKMRALTLGNMFIFLSNLDFDISTELNFRSFTNAVSNNKKFKFAKVSLRRYNYSNIQSKIINVHPLDWELAIMLSTEKFFDKKNSRATSQAIWKETRLNTVST